MSPFLPLDRNDSMISNKKKITWFALFLFVLAAVAMSRRLIAPADWVEVHLEQVPSDVSAIYLVAKKNGQIRPLKWYRFKVYSSLDDPKRVGQQWYWTVRGTQRMGDLQWVTAESMGVLAKLKSKEWTLWWLNPEDINGPSSMRYLLGGGEKVTIQTLGRESSGVAPQALIDQVTNDDM